MDIIATSPNNLGYIVESTTGHSHGPRSRPGRAQSANCVPCLMSLNCTYLEIGTQHNCPLFTKFDSRSRTLLTRYIAPESTIRAPRACWSLARHSSGANTSAFR